MKADFQKILKANKITCCWSVKGIYWRKAVNNDTHQLNTSAPFQIKHRLEEPTVHSFFKVEACMATMDPRISLHLIKKVVADPLAPLAGEPITVADRQ